MTAVLLGTLYPLVRRAFGDRLSVGADYYTLVCTPLVWILLVGLIVGPARSTNRTYVAANVATSLPRRRSRGVSDHSLPRSRSAWAQPPCCRRSWHSFSTPRRRAGAFIVHAGFAMLLVGVAGSALGSSRTIAMRPGERVAFEGYDIVLDTTRRGVGRPIRSATGAIPIERARHRRRP